MNFPQEFVLNLQINDWNAIRLICTGDALRELVTGFLCNEGLVTSAEQIEELTLEGDRAHVRLPALRRLPTETRPSGLGSPVLTQSVPEPRPVRNRYTPEFLGGCVEQMQTLAVRYSQTGGMHCSALFLPSGLVASFEDIGRHNTLDKLAGYCLLRGISAEDTLLLTSGRISSDMVRKAARMGVSVIASYSTATQGAYELARAGNMTLVVYAGKRTQQICCTEERIG